jgi:hypothetical protein
MPNLGYLLKSKLGTHQPLESLLHDRIVEYLHILKNPTTHAYHWNQKAHWIRFLFKHHDQLHNFMLDTFQQIPNSPIAFQTAWDRYVTNFCLKYELQATQHYPKPYPACAAKDVCLLCTLQWDKSPNATRRKSKCTCCEMKAEEFLLPEISFYEPNSTSGSQDDKLNQHIWSISDTSTQLIEPLEPAK